MQLTRDSLLDEESRMLLESLATFRLEVLDELSLEMDESPASGRVEEAWKKSASLGLSDALLSEEKGGQGMGADSFCLSMDELAMGSAGFAMVVLSHNMAVWALERAGAEVDSTLLKGEERAALAWPFESINGAGMAPFIPGGTEASEVVFLQPDSYVINTVSLEGGDAMLTEIENPLGFRAARPARLKLESKGSRAVGGLGMEGADELEARLLLGVGAIANGLARRSYEKAYLYAGERYQGGDLIINHQQIRLMLANMLVGIEAAEACVLQAAMKGFDASHLPACRAAKVLACDRAVETTLEGVQVHGGYGYMRDYGMELLMRDAKYCQAYPRSQQEERLDMLGEMGEVRRTGGSPGRCPVTGG